jgi:hypothetical protein
MTQAVPDEEERSNEPEPEPDEEAPEVIGPPDNPDAPEVEF